MSLIEPLFETGGGSGASTGFTSDDLGLNQYSFDDAGTMLYKPNGGYYQRAICGNRGMMPSTTTSSANQVRFSRVLLTIPNNASFTDPVFFFPNWGQNSASEFGGPDNVNLKFSLEGLDGTEHNATFDGGNTSTGVANNYTAMCDPMAGLTLTPGTQYYMITRTVGALGTLARLVGQGTHVIFGEGAFNGADPTVDYTDGVYGKGARAGSFTIDGSGNITAVSMSGGSGGSNYLANVSVYAYQRLANGTLVNKTIGNSNLTAGAVSSITVSSGTPPAGLAAWTQAAVIVIGNKFSASTSVFAPCMVTGRTGSSVKSLIIDGDSIGIGFTSTDSIGDVYRNFGIYERALANRCGVVNLSASGAFASTKALGIFKKTYDLFAGRSTHVQIPLGTNDVQGGASKASLQTNLGTIATRWRNAGASVDYTKLIPRDTSSDAFATVVNQTPATGFTLGGVADLHNADIVSGAVVSDRQYIDARTLFQDSTTTTAWDITQANTTDGTHPNLLGIATAENDTGLRSQYASLG